LITGTARLLQHQNFDQHLLDALYGPEVAQLLAGVPDLHTRSVDEPNVPLRDIDPTVIRRANLSNRVMLVNFATSLSEAPLHARVPLPDDRPTCGKNFAAKPTNSACRDVPVFSKM
jgi:hypothetical protein